MIFCKEILAHIRYLCIEGREILHEGSSVGLQVFLRHRIMHRVVVGMNFDNWLQLNANFGQ